MNDFEFHRQSPQVSCEQYSLAKRLQLGQTVTSVPRIYLDQRYWIFCRDALLGRPQKSIHGRIWELLRKAVADNRAVCPVCYPVFCETLKMNRESRMATARVIDRLSRGVAIQPLFRRFALELSHFAWTCLRGDKTLSSLDRQVWLPLGYLAGEMVPTATALGPEDELAIQKAMYDVIDRRTMTELVVALGQETPPALDDSRHQEALTVLSRLHRGDFATFRDVYALEVDGVVDCWEEEIGQYAAHLFAHDRAFSLDDTPAASAAASARTLSMLIRTGLKMGRITTELPSCHIYASVHAAIRHKGQKHKKGDLWDHLHASAALPYCSAFFTEKSMASLLTQRPLQLDRLYKCSVLSDENHVLGWLESL